MNTVFFRILNMGIVASWLILAVIIIRAVCKDMPKGVSCILWGLVAARLFCPFSVESKLSLIPDKDVMQSKTGIANLTIAAAGNRILVLEWLWIIGALSVLCVVLIQYCKVRKKVSEAVLLTDNIWLCDIVRVPFIIGIFRPRIYLPAEIGKKELPYVLAHEKAHIRRLDPLWKLIGVLALVIYWFNPLVWTAFILWGKDMELACDEKVLSRLTQEEKKSYAEALLSCSTQRRMVLSFPLAFGENAVKERVRAALRHEKVSLLAAMTSVVLCLMTAVCFLTNPPAKKEYIKVNTAVSPGEPVKVVKFDVNLPEVKPHEVKVTVKKNGPLVYLYFDTDFEDTSAEYIVSFEEER